MKLLFLTLGALSNIEQTGIYTDLLRCFKDKGNDVYIICPLERRTKMKTSYQKEHGINVLRVRIGNITKTRIFEKGISTLLVGKQYKNAIKKYLSKVKFDLVLYSTPPITLAEVIRFVKNRDNAFTYLLLKDIFPQNAVDIGLLKKTGIRGLIYKYFQIMEKELYIVSDKIGCLSDANTEFVLGNKYSLEKDRIEVCPNTIDPIIEKPTDKIVLCRRFGLPSDKLLFLYGGNFGRPQNVDYIVDILKESICISEIHFIMCGSGTDFYKIKEYTKQVMSKNVTVIDALEFSEYTSLVSICDVGLIFLDYRFTVPNFPSRMLDYMNYSLPVLASTDKNTDVGSVITNGGFGWWCESSSVSEYIGILKEIIKNYNNNNLYLKEKGICSRNYFEEHFATYKAYSIITNSYKLERNLEYV